MIDRRRLLAATSVLAVTPVLGHAATAPVSEAAKAEGAKMQKLFGDLVNELLDRSPEAATGVGFDIGPRAHQRSELSDRSLATAARYKADDAKDLARLHAIDRAVLTPGDQVSYDVVDYVSSATVKGEQSFGYANGNLQGPYQLSQLTGAYQAVPDFLDSQHPVKTKADAEAYLARLAAFPIALDQDIEQVRHDVGLGVTPPDFVLDKTLTQLAALRGEPADKANLVQSLVRRARAANIDGDWEARATKIYTGQVQPALDRQIALAKDLRARAVHDAGVWRLPKGGEYYAQSLAQATTTTMSPAEVHKLGLDMVAKLSAEVDVLMKAAGYSKGTVGERFRALYSDPKYHYPNTDEGKEKLLADLNLKVQEVTKKLPAYFGVLPKSPLQIKRVPKATEAGAPGGYYNGAALDGSRPGMYYINLRDTAEVPSWTLPTLTFHEGIPGHHLQISIAQEAPLPIIRRVIGFNAYQEGWALYAEQLADEMGMYATDPLGKIGFLHDAIFRAVRLVVDSGMHEFKWSRERAVKYYVDHIGDQEASSITEIERYCVWPGQACSYMVGKLTWLRLRAKAKAALGAQFDIRKFHDVALTNGAMPLKVLETVIDTYIVQTKAA
ncbi:MAG: DUF885 family protein [Pseudomonadota bacterium]|nr:DUF885 family protein [Pseudomonadota bacterium]